MAGEVTVQSGWQLKQLKELLGLLELLKEVRDGEVQKRSVPTMADTGEVDLRGFIRTISRRKWLLLLTMGASMGATMYWMSQASPLYSADVLIVIETRPSSIVKVDEAVQDDISSDTAKVNTEVAVLESRGLAARVIHDLDLDSDPEFAPQSTDELSDKVGPPTFAADGPAASASSGGAGEEVPSSGFRAKIDLWELLTTALRSARTFLTSARAGEDGGTAQSAEEASIEGQQIAELLEATEARDRAALLDRFFQRLSVEPEDASRLIRINFTSSDPAKAALIANRLVEEYIKSQLETKTEGARRAAEWLDARLAELGETVRSLEQDVQRQRTETGTNRIGIVSQRLAEINTQLVDAQAASGAAHARYEQVRTVLEGGGNLDGLPAIIASTNVQTLRVKHTELVGSLSELRTVYGKNHPQIISIRAEIAQIEQRLNRDIHNILAGLRNELESAEIQEAELRSELQSASEEMAQLNESETSIGQVAQRLRANQDLYQSLLKRFTEAVALRDNQQPDARIISPAQIPLTPSFPNAPRVTALSFVGSASLAVLLLVVTERLRQKLDTVEDVERHVGLQVIGAIPDLPRLRRLASAPGDYIRREPLSEFGGAFQRLRALLVLGNNRNMPRTILVASGSAGEGKTTIAVCLGIASVSSGQKVLIVDCDFARPQVHRMVNVNNDKGLTDVLKGTATLEETVTQAAGYRLSILPIGRSREGAIDLLNSGRMEQLLHDLKATFDLIILDSAPVLEVSNALILGGLAERTLLVTRRDWTTHRNASYAAKQLQLYGADLAGVAFNRTDTAAS
jgi:capsular exopolysaccharide synthesis family protein